MTDRYRVHYYWLQTATKSRRRYKRYDVIDFQTDLTVNEKPMTRPKAHGLASKLNEAERAKS